MAAITGAIGVARDLGAAQIIDAAIADEAAIILAATVGRVDAFAARRVTDAALAGHVLALILDRGRAVVCRVVWLVVAAAGSEQHRRQRESYAKTSSR